MRRYKTPEVLFNKVDSSFAQKVPNEAYHAKDSVGRPPKSLLASSRHPAQKVKTFPGRYDAYEATVGRLEVEASLRDKRDKPPLWHNGSVTVQE